MSRKPRTTSVPQSPRSPSGHGAGRGLKERPIVVDARMAGAGAATAVGHGRGRQYRGCVASPETGKERSLTVPEIATEHARRCRGTANGHANRSTLAHYDGTTAGEVGRLDSPLTPRLLPHLRGRTVAHRGSTGAANSDCHVSIYRLFAERNVNRTYPPCGSPPRHPA